MILPTRLRKAWYNQRWLIAHILNAEQKATARGSAYSRPRERQSKLRRGDWNPGLTDNVWQMHFLLLQKFTSSDWCPALFSFLDNLLVDLKDDPELWPAKQERSKYDDKDSSYQFDRFLLCTTTALSADADVRFLLSALLRLPFHRSLLVFERAKSSRMGCVV
jgi:hypothetical protein